MTYQVHRNTLVCKIAKLQRQYALHASLLVVACLFTPLAVHAYSMGHAQVTSAPGQPLIVMIPVKNLTPADIAQFSAKVSSAAQWSSAGLKPPVTLDSIKVEVLPATVADQSQRLIKITSTEQAQGPVVDMLIDVATAAGSKSLQASVIVLPAPTVQAPGGQALNVQRGDTLWSIAEKYPTAGANIYQTLVAIFQANPNAFIKQNMNLLRTGATLRLPSAADVLAMSPSQAQQIFNQHLQAFNALRGVQGGQPVQKLPSASNQETSKGQVEPIVNPPPATGNEVRLSSSDAATQQADQATSASRQAADEKARLEALKGNLASQAGVKGSAANGSAVGKPGTAGSSATGSSSATSSSNVTAGAAAVDASTSSVQTDLTTQVESTFNKVRIWLADNTFIAAVILLAIMTWLIALFMKNASNRREEDQPSGSMPSETQQHAFKNKLSGINLDLDDKPTGEDKKI